MQKKIFRSIFMTVMLAVIVFGIIAVAFGFRFYRQEAETELAVIATVATKQKYSDEEINDILKETLNYEVRYTRLDLEGNVIYDNFFETSELENHKERREIAEALKKGEGQATRLSKTMSTTSYYYALKDGDCIYRFSRERNSVVAIFLGVVGLIVVISAVVIVVATIISVKLSENAIKPITQIVNNLDVLDENLQVKVEYEELEPIVEAMKKLSERLSRYIRRLKNEKEKISLITENMVEGMILLDEKETILSVNKSAIEFLNPNFSYSEGAKISELVKNQSLIDGVKIADEEGTSYGVISTPNKQIQFYVNKAGFNNTHGFMILLVDATEKLRAEEIRKDFSANVSHELKTPLTTIKGFGEMLENGIFADMESVKKYGGTIFRESERLLALINDIIRLSEIEELSADETAEEICLLDVANDVEETLQLKADKHKISVSVEGEKFTVKANKSYMMELFLNLIDNAIKYNNEGGHVFVKVEKRNGLAYIVVKDDGIGISAEHQDRIFERFYRVDKSRSKQTGGTGLGLSIVKHIASYHNGSISIQSEIGEGTEITVTIPCL
ncbi:MAG: hypothetical protein E7509_05100 [Ruminococcus sp.]|nr:hypothetical protein [Ruminococcus sp.]